MTGAPKLDAWRLIRLLESDKVGDWSGESLVEVLKTIAVSADDELAAAEQRYEIDLKKIGEKDVVSDEEIAAREDKFKKERVNVWASLVGGLQVVLKKSGSKSEALDQLLSALLETARGKRETRFSVRAVGGVKDMTTAFNQALIIAALESHPDRRTQIIKNGARLLGKQPAYVKKLPDNFDQGRLRKEITKLVDMLKSMKVDDGFNVFGKLIRKD